MGTFAHVIEEQEIIHRQFVDISVAVKSLAMTVIRNEESTNYADMQKTLADLDAKVEVRPVIYVALTYDSRLIYAESRSLPARYHCTEGRVPI